MTLCKQYAKSSVNFIKHVNKNSNIFAELVAILKHSTQNHNSCQDSRDHVYLCYRQHHKLCQYVVENDSCIGSVIKYVGDISHTNPFKILKAIF